MKQTTIDDEAQLQRELRPLRAKEASLLSTIGSARREIFQLEQQASGTMMDLAPRRGAQAQAQRDRSAKQSHRSRKRRPRQRQCKPPPHCAARKAETKSASHGPSKGPATVAEAAARLQRLTGGRK